MFDRAEVRFDASIMTKKMQTLYKKKFGSESVRRLQKRLALLGYNPGKPDGKAGARTRRAIRWFQKAHGLPVDGKPSTELLQMAIKERKRVPDHVKIPPASRGQRFQAENLSNPLKCEPANPLKCEPINQEEP